ncbi:hypothetical protein OG905_36345 [Streptomyces sp. NBC_00322]|uniref:hypothetical protein n=1 Tax=Streptomyces sp. NBC_00322 TaxID=2975712 RepID=UPI002E2A4F2A|nr:hypothetical protein [Streptomyces sp. NBC_00322]
MGAPSSSIKMGFRLHASVLAAVGDMDLATLPPGTSTRPSVPADAPVGWIYECTGADTATDD